MLMAFPSGWTSTSMAVKSVSVAEVDAYRVAVIGPVTSTACSRGGVVNTRMSSRSAMSARSKGPGGVGPNMRLPPRVGTGFIGSKTNSSTGSDAPGISMLSVPSPAEPFALPPLWK